MLNKTQLLIYDVFDITHFTLMADALLILSVMVPLLFNIMRCIY